jgi:hypothetical protein
MFKKPAHRLLQKFHEKAPIDNSQSLSLHEGCLVNMLTTSVFPKSRTSPCGRTGWRHVRPPVVNTQSGKGHLQSPGSLLYWILADHLQSQACFDCAHCVTSISSSLKSWIGRSILRCKEGKRFEGTPSAAVHLSCYHGHYSQI